MASKIDANLTECAATPFLGTVPAAGKVVLGVGQAVVGLVSGVFLSLWALIRCNCEVLDWSKQQVKKGGERVLYGTLEAIPLVGTHIYLKSLPPDTMLWNRVKVGKDMFGKDLTDWHPFTMRHIEYFLTPHKDDISATAPFDMAGRISLGAIQLLLGIGTLFYNACRGKCSDGGVIIWGFRNIFQGAFYREMVPYEYHKQTIGNVTRINGIVQPKGSIRL